MTDEEFLANLGNIDNEKLIQSLQSCGHDGYYNDLYYPIIEEIKRRLSLYPSADPERKKGKWQRRKKEDCWECSECHAVLEIDDIVQHNYYYCYHCGANMMNKDGYMKLEGTEYE